MNLRAVIVVTSSLMMFGCNSVVTERQTNSQKTFQPKLAATSRNGCILEDERNPTVEQMKRAVVNCFNKDRSGNGRLKVPASNQPRELSFELNRDAYAEKQIGTTGLLSYLLYRDGKVVVDLLTPKERLGDIYDNSTLMQSNSVGKSLTGYLVGHAICQGYIDGVDEKISDWPLFQNTLYGDQKIIDLLNMNIGDSKYVRSSQIKFANPLKRNGVNHMHMAYWSKSLQGTTPPSFKRFNYSQLVSNMIANYVQYKAGSKYEELLDSFYREKIGIASALELGRQDLHGRDRDGLLNTDVFATRYDFLRMAISILEDWENDTCEGKYLKTLYSRAVKGNDEHGLFRWRTNGYNTNYRYAGFFHTDASRIKGKAFVMHGFGGQIILINFDTGVIIATQAAHEDFITRKLVVDAANNAAK